MIDYLTFTLYSNFMMFGLFFTAQSSIFSAQKNGRKTVSEESASCFALASNSLAIFFSCVYWLKKNQNLPFFVLRRYPRNCRRLSELHSPSSTLWPD